MIDTRHGAARLLDFLPDQTMPAGCLVDLAGDAAKARIGARASGLEIRISEAWVIPMESLSCGQCRMLVGQRLALEWLARPVTAFAIRYPRVECDLYPGDLTVISLVVWRDLMTFAPDGARQMLAQDYEWLRREADEEEWSGSILKQAVAALDDALKS